MTKRILPIIIILFLTQSCHSQLNKSSSQALNYIDSIQNAKQIANLVTKIDERFQSFKLNYPLKFSDAGCQNRSDSLNIKSWAKADFDNNGLTDILLVGSRSQHSVICILDKGDMYEVRPITRASFQECSFPVVENNKIKYYYEDSHTREDWDKPRKLQEVILVYKFGDFIEENKNPANHKIEKIEYATTMCYGTCPVFDLAINSDRSAVWNAEMYNTINDKEISGIFHSTISGDNYDELIALLNYIDFETLKNKYAVNWTDDQSSTLKITYDNGKIKSIEDYGLLGTFGLQRVYQIMFDLRAMEEWR